MASSSSRTSGKSGDISYSVMTITPALAKQWLGENTHNRHLNEKHVATLAGAIKRGEWELNGAAITRAKDGTLIDGQHRLHAVVKADKAIKSFVGLNMPMSTQETVDAGKKRTFGHVLQLRGYTHADQLASATRALYVYRAIKRFDTQGLTGRMSNENQKVVTAPTNQQLLNLLIRNNGLQESVHVTHACRKLGPVKLPAGAAAFHYVVSERFDSDIATEFLEKVCDLNYGGKQDPMVELRKRLLSGQATGSRPMHARLKMALMVKAFNLWMLGEPADGTKLRWRSGGPAAEPFPMLVSKDEVS